MQMIVKHRFKMNIFGSALIVSIRQRIDIYIYIYIGRESKGKKKKTETF